MRTFLVALIIACGIFYYVRSHSLETELRDCRFNSVEYDE